MTIMLLKCVSHRFLYRKFEIKQGREKGGEKKERAEKLKIFLNYFVIAAD